MRSYLTILLSVLIIIIETTAVGSEALFFNHDSLLLNETATYPFRKLQSITTSALPPLRCENGFVGGYSCKNIGLQARIPLFGLGAFGDETKMEASDVWGWTDPRTNREYAIIGLYQGTAFVDITFPQSPVLIAKLAATVEGSSTRGVKNYGRYAYIVSETEGHGVQIFDMAQLALIKNPPVFVKPTSIYTFSGSFPVFPQTRRSFPNTHRNNDMNGKKVRSLRGSEDFISKSDTVGKSMTNTGGSNKQVNDNHSEYYNYDDYYDDYYTNDDYYDDYYTNDDYYDDYYTNDDYYDDYYTNDATNDDYYDDYFTNDDYYDDHYTNDNQNGVHIHSFDDNDNHHSDHESSNVHHHPHPHPHPDQILTNNNIGFISFDEHDMSHTTHHTLNPNNNHDNDDHENDADTSGKPPWYVQGGDAHNIAINEQTGYAYIVGSDKCNGGLFILDINIPLTPKFAGCFTDTGFIHDVQCIIYNGPDSVYKGREICFAANGRNGLTIIDVTNKSGPLQVSRIEKSYFKYISHGTLSEDQAFYLLGDEGDNTGKTKTYVVDITDLDKPRVSGVHQSSINAQSHIMYSRGRYIYQANYHGGLRVLDFLEIYGDNSEAGVFDTYKPDDNYGFSAGAYGVYPYFRSGNILVSTVKDGLFILQPSWLEPPSQPIVDPIVDPVNPPAADDPGFIQNVLNFFTGIIGA